MRNVWRAAMFGNPWRTRVVSDDAAGRGLDQGQARSWQNKRAKLDEIAPVSTKVVSGTTRCCLRLMQNVRSCYDSYDLAHTEVVHFTVGNAFLVTPLMEYCVFAIAYFLQKATFNSHPSGLV